ncbi:fasciclin domain-containing protein [Novosphingobium sp. Gsoil 351]|uniref:fasciclin domain-containing protein n=1 Tax=Novosphingobium sp. Gsoil 351 TaxID=2675225 RepID=UPI0018A8179B|nr:fasciclin domain-containing protein [Novosphingobium sp. Gsoil 351]
MHRSLAWALAALALVPLAACDKADKAATDDAAPKVSSETLTAAIGGTPGLTTVAAALKGTGLANVFDGTAPYTLLAPDDDAFGKLGETGTMLKAPENGAAMASVIKAHVLPGYVTVKDIDAALKAARGKPVRMTTMAGDEVTFVRDGEALSVTAADGSTARVSGSDVAAGNGVAIPVDTVLKKVPSAAEG